MIERKIIIGLITSTEYTQSILSIFNPELLEARSAQVLSKWIIQYFNEFRQVPGKSIEDIYIEKIKTERVSKEEAGEIEDVLQSLNDEYQNEESFNIGYLVKQTETYLTKRGLKIFSEKIVDFVDNENLLEAEKLASAYHPTTHREETGLDLSDIQSLEKIQQIFEFAYDPVVRYPKQLGIFWNEQLIRGRFIAFMGSEKRGKTFILLDMAIRASKQKSKVAFFQAGDMTENEQLMRICIHLKRKSNLKKYCGEQFEPVRDCVYNQLNTCDRKERDNCYGLFKGKTEYEIRSEINIGKLKELYKRNPDYEACTNCKDYMRSKWGTVWLKQIDVGKPLTVEEAKEVVTDFFIKNKRTFKISTHPNGTLSVDKIKIILDIWERQDGFIPDLIVIDYADLLIADKSKEFRHQQNEIWKELRGLNQEKNCLLVTATQADADSYTRDLLTLSNFSEDKRKYAHVTAMYGLNQDHKGREKEIGIMRINELVIREGEFNNSNQIYVLQNLRRGLPFLESFF